MKFAPSRRTQRELKSFGKGLLFSIISGTITGLTVTKIIDFRRERKAAKSGSSIAGEDETNPRISAPALDPVPGGEVEPLDPIQETWNELTAEET